MRKKMLFVMLLLPFLIAAGDSTGQKLVYRLWKNFQNRRIHVLQKELSSHFQFLDRGVSSNKSEALRLLRHLTILSYSIRDIKISRKRNLLLASYYVSALEQLKNETFTRNGFRISVWRKVHNSWILEHQEDLSPQRVVHASKPKTQVPAICKKVFPTRRGFCHLEPLPGKLASLAKVERGIAPFMRNLDFVHLNEAISRRCWL